MKTKSCWGEPPARIYHFINKYGDMFNTVCVIGCSDGKFVFPFLRKGYDVTAVDIDEVALFGGIKEKPIERLSSDIKRRDYISASQKPVYERLPVESIRIMGLSERAKKENLLEKLHIIEQDAYHNPLRKTYDVVFTSCSIQYKNNRDMSVSQIMDCLKKYVNLGGFLYMDYMMPLEDSHTWKSETFFRSGEIRGFFRDNWEICHIYEMKKPIFELAHIDRSEDHFHRFGYILAKKLSEGG